MRRVRIGPDMPKVSLRRTNYLGGHPKRVKAIGGGVLTFDRDGIRITVLMEKPFEFGWEEVAKLAVEGRDEVQRRVTATRLVAMGLPFAAPQSLASSAFIVVTTSTGDAIFESPTDVQQLRTSLHTAIAWVEQRHGHQRKRASAEAAHQEVADEIARLSKLRADGVLTDAGFEIAKARLLS
jgi:hypothetical protein